VAVNKPCGISVQEELTARLRAYLDGKIEPSLSFRPGPLHRLGREASGVIVFGSSLAGARRFSELMRGGLIQKTYIALLEGGLRSERIWRDELLYSRSARKALVCGGGVPPGDARFAQTRVVPLDERGVRFSALRRPEVRRQRTAAVLTRSPPVISGRWILSGLQFHPRSLLPSSGNLKAWA
jgi:23S rRNA pseudouridine955/2504/2580 synthase